MIYEVWSVNETGTTAVLVYRSSLSGCQKFIDNHFYPGCRSDEFVLVPRGTQWRP